MVQYSSPRIDNDFSAYMGVCVRTGRVWMESIARERTETLEWLNRHGEPGDYPVRVRIVRVQQDQRSDGDGI